MKFWIFLKNQVTRFTDDSSDDDDIQNFFGRIEHSSALLTEEMSINRTFGEPSNYADVLQKQRSIDTEIVLQSTSKREDVILDKSRETCVTKFKEGLSCETRTKNTKLKNYNSSTVYPELCPSTNVITSDKTNSGRPKRFLLTKRKR